MSAISSFITNPVTNTNNDIINSISKVNTLSTGLVNDLGQVSAAMAGVTAGTSLHTNLVNINDRLQTRLTDANDLVTSLYSQAGNVNTSFSNDITAANQLIANANTVNTMITSETQLSNQRLQNINDERNNKLRLAQINTYYSKKYDAQSEIMKIIIMSCVIILILWYLKTSELLPLPDIFFTILISLMIAISSIIIFYKVYYISIRDDNDFDQYNFEIKQSNLPPIIVNPDVLSGSTGTFTNTAINCVANPTLCCPKGFAFNASGLNCQLISGS